MTHRHRLLFARVDSLVILDEWEGQHALVGVHGGLECLQIHPQVVGVEELVFGDVFKVRFAAVWAHRRFAQCELTVRLADAQMSPLLV